MIILGIESTAHTFGVGLITEEGKVLANIQDMYTVAEGGMILDDVAAHHKQVADTVIDQALQTAGIGWESIDLIAYSAGPGLPPSLWFGYHKAKELATLHQKKLVGVNHCCAHLSIGKIINNLTDPCYLYVSGVNTQIIVGDDNDGYTILGETLDIGLGNMLDKFGRTLTIGFPAGPAIEQLAKKGKYVTLPYAVKGMDVSFTGILTKVQQLFTRKQSTKEDLCFSVQETCFAMVAEVAERAMAHAHKTELLLVGGVGANKRFCEMLAIMCQERGAQFYKVPPDLAGDNGAMIAWEGYLRRNQYGDEQAKPHWRTDEC